MTRQTKPRPNLFIAGITLKGEGESGSRPVDKLVAYWNLERKSFPRMF